MSIRSRRRRQAAGNEYNVVLTSRDHQAAVATQQAAEVDEQEPEDAAKRKAELRAIEEAARKVLEQEAAKQAAKEAARKEALRQESEQRRSGEAIQKATEEEAAKQSAAAAEAATQEVLRQEAERKAEQRRAEGAARKAAEAEEAKNTAEEAATQEALRQETEREAQQRLAEEAARRAVDEEAAKQAEREERLTKESARKAAAEEEAAKQAAGKVTREKAWLSFFSVAEKDVALVEEASLEVADEEAAKQLPEEAQREEIERMEQRLAEAGVSTKVEVIDELQLRDEWVHEQRCLGNSVASRGVTDHHNLPKLTMSKSTHDREEEGFIGLKQDCCAVVEGQYGTECSNIGDCLVEAKVSLYLVDGKEAASAGQDGVNEACQNMDIEISKTIELENGEEGGGKEEDEEEEEEEEAPMTLVTQKNAFASFRDENVNRVELFERLVETSHDILAAKTMLGLIAHDEAALDSLKRKASYRRYEKELEAFYAIGETCFASGGNWFEAFSDDAGTQTIHGSISESCPSVLHYRVCAQIPANLKAVIAVTHEVQFMPEWNTLVLNEPKVVGRRTAHHMTINYQLSALAGMIKFDVLNGIRRFTDTEGGLIAEFVESIDEGDPSYFSPCPGFQRPQTKVANVFAACGAEHTVLIQAGTLKLPFAISQWLASAGAYVAGKFVVSGLVKNAMLATEPGNRWDDAVAEDTYGLYQRLDECIASEASKGRMPSSSIANLGLPQYFERH